MDAKQIAEELDREGIVFLPKIISDQQLREMQEAFEQALKHPTWNTWLGYEQSEKWRLMLENMLILDKSFVDFALTPLVMDVFQDYLGKNFVLTEARGWETVKTNRKFHGWHNDAWYAHHLAESERPREVKLVTYLTDCYSGHFSCIKKTHKMPGLARHWNDREIAHLKDDIVHVKGEAGTAVIFDTACIHKQSTPILMPRRALFFNYHDPTIPLQDIDVEYGRYAPILLNPAYLGGRTEEEMRILGVGQDWKTNHYHERTRRFPVFHDTFRRALEARVWLKDITDQGDTIYNGIKNRIGRLFGS